MSAWIAIVGSLAIGAFNGFTNTGFIGVFIGALWFGAVHLWENRDLLKLSHEETSGVGAPHDFFTRLGQVAIYLALALISAGLQALTYFPAAWLRHQISN